LNKGKAAFMAVMDELYATDFVFHGISGNDIHGLKNYKQHFSEVFSAYDFHETINDMFVEGDKVATRITWTGTNKGEYTGRPPYK
jgi:predicted ester cyclase